MTRLNRQWILRRRPVGDIGPDDLELRESPIPVPASGQVLARTIYLSLDPAQRISMSDLPQYQPPVPIGQVMRGGTLSVVEVSCHPDFEAGDMIAGPGGWQEYSLLMGGRRIAGDQVPLTAHMSVLGITGATAYFGLLDIGRPRPGDTVVVSAAAGAVGSIAGQIAKLKGCRVVGLAGSDAKCRHVVERLGFDACINHRNEDVATALRRECPDGIDVDFENVGGDILDAVLSHINLKARIVLCGLIATYNAPAPTPGPFNFRNILMKRVRVEGFIIGDYLERLGEAFADISGWLAAGLIRYDVQIVDGIENAPSALGLLFRGGNVGKLLLRVSEEPRTTAEVTHART